MYQAGIDGSLKGTYLFQNVFLKLDSDSLIRVNHFNTDHQGEVRQVGLEHQRRRNRSCCQDLELQTEHVKINNKLVDSYWILKSPLRK